jgi:hypothetical protein
MTINKRSRFNVFMALVLLVALVGNVFAAYLRYWRVIPRISVASPGITILAQQLAYEHENLIVANMHEWSGGRYKAITGHLNIISVAAVTIVQDIHGLVFQTIKECAPITLKPLATP